MSAKLDAGVLGDYYTMKPASNSADIVQTLIFNKNLIFFVWVSIYLKVDIIKLEGLKNKLDGFVLFANMKQSFLSHQGMAL